MASSVLVRREGPRATLLLNRPERRNSLDHAAVAEYHAALDGIDRDPGVRVVVLQGSGGVFCSGMDLEAFAGDLARGGQAEAVDLPYMGLLKRLSSLDRIVVSKVEGTVLAGGVGLVAASDLVYATPDSTFGLSEALWGLLPAMVMPFLIRRVGYQSAFRLTLTAAAIDGAEAQRIHLVDELGADPDGLIHAAIPRLVRVHPRTVADMKAYFRSMWIVDEAMEQRAVGELSRLMRDPRVQENIRNYVDYGRLPWETW
jgi:polyketide biosynthesis enoyl-CoA hydratase PksH